MSLIHLLYVDNGFVHWASEAHRHPFIDVKPSNHKSGGEFPDIIRTIETDSHFCIEVELPLNNFGIRVFRISWHRDPLIPVEEPRHRIQEIEHLRGGVRRAGQREPKVLSQRWSLQIHQLICRIRDVELSNLVDGVESILGQCRSGDH
jgi:hypothetical protein